MRTLVQHTARGRGGEWYSEGEGGGMVQRLPCKQAGRLAGQSVGAWGAPQTPDGSGDVLGRVIRAQG